MSEKFRLDRKIGFQNTFYTKCINVIIESIGPSIILRSIFLSLFVLQECVLMLMTLAVCQAHRGLPVGFLLLRYSVLFTVESLSLLYLLVIS